MSQMVLLWSKKNVIYRINIRTCLMTLLCGSERISLFIYCVKRIQSVVTAA